MKVYDSNGIPIIASSGGGGGSLLSAISAGTQLASTGTVQFADSNGISFGMSGSSQVTALLGSIGLPIHDFQRHSGNVFPGDVDQFIGSAFQEFAETTPPASSNNRARLFAQKLNSETDMFYVDGDGMVVALGQDNLVTMRNTTGVTLTRGQVVYVSGASANLPKIDLAQSDTEATMPAIGIVAEDILTGSNGKVMCFGVLVDIDTSAFAAGDRLFVDFATPGALVATQPLWPNIVQRVAVVMVSDAVNGKLLVAPTGQRGDVGIQAVSAGTQNFVFDTQNQMVFSNSNGLAFGMDNGTVTGSYTVPVVPPETPFAISAGTQSGSTGTMVFSNSNGISFGMSGSSRVTASHDGLTSQSNQAVSGSNGSFTFQTVTFGSSNGMHFYTTNGSVVGSYTQTPETPFAISAGTQSGSTGTMVFSNSNGISFGMSGSSRVTASHDGLTSQSNQAASGQNGSFTFQTLLFSNANGISFGTSAGPALTASHNAITSQSNQQMTMFATGNTTQSSSGTTNASSLIFRGDGVASVGITNGSVVISVPAGGGGLTNINVSAGTTSQNLSNIVFSNSNGVSFGLNGSTVTASAAGGGGGGFTAPGFHPYDDLVQVVGQVGQGTLQFDPQLAPNFSFDRLGFFVQNTNSSNSSGSHTLSFWVGLYTRNASTLSLSTSWSVSTAVTHSGTAGSYSRYSGGRLLALTVAAVEIPASRYWIAFLSRTTSGGTNGTYSNYMVSNVNSQFTGLFGTASNATHQPKLGQGYYSATTSGLPNSVAFSQINGTASLARRMPVIGFHSNTA